MLIYKHKRKGRTKQMLIELIEAVETEDYETIKQILDEWDKEGK